MSMSLNSTILQDAAEKIRRCNAMGKAAPTDGKWLEDLTIEVASLIPDWDIEECWSWSNWTKLSEDFKSSRDLGIDAVGRRRGDGGLVAIQCKSRQLDDRGAGNPITKKEIDSFSSLSSGREWKERWVVTHGEVDLAKNALDSVPKENPIRQVHILKDIQQQLSDWSPCYEERGANDDGEVIQTRSSMQDEAVNRAVNGLRANVEAESGGLPKGRARGRIVLPCGTGKTRIALRIVEELTEEDGLAVVLCPSIALVAQLRREFLQNAERRLRTISVCSDKTAGFFRTEDAQSRLSDPTADTGYVSASEIKGMVTTDPREIAVWIKNDRKSVAAGNPVADSVSSLSALNVIFGTYQSSHRIGEALLQAGWEADVLIADEAHRTAGLKKAAKPDAAARLRDFTVCHDDARFPVKHRVYQTATPRVYENRAGSRAGKTDYAVRSMDDESVFGVELYRRSYTEAVKNEWLTDYRIIALGVNDQESFSVANEMANKFVGKRNAPTTATLLGGLVMALVMGGGLGGGLVFAPA